MDLKLKGRVALLTGASSGLGFATAKTLAEEGVKIAINSRSTDRLEEARQQLATIHPDIIILPGDVTQQDTHQHLMDKTVSQYGQLDLLFTNAGGPPPAAFESIDDDTWEHAVDLSFMSHVRLIRAALPYLRKSPAASVLAVASISVKQPIANLILSNSVRAATVGLIKTLALELGGDGIRFNAILPSYTRTERVDQLMENRANERGTTVTREIETMNAQSPLGRMGTPQEFANAAVFLLSPAASYLTGVMLPVDGGTYKGLF